MRESEAQSTIELLSELDTSLLASSASWRSAVLAEKVRVTFKPILCACIIEFNTLPNLLRKSYRSGIYVEPKARGRHLGVQGKQRVHDAHELEEELRLLAREPARVLAAQAREVLARRAAHLRTQR